MEHLSTFRAMLYAIIIDAVACNLKMILIISVTCFIIKEALLNYQAINIMSNKYLIIITIGNYCHTSIKDIHRYP